MKHTSLDLRTGELHNGIGKEIFRAYITRNPSTKSAYLNLKISFPIFKPEKNETFWLWSETCIDYDASQEVLSYLKSDKSNDLLLRTGLDYDRSVSFTNDWIKSEEVPCKKIRIVMPGFNDKPSKKAITKLNNKNVKKLCNFIHNFIESECNIKNKIYKNTNSEIKLLETRINNYKAKIEEIAKKIGDTKEEIYKNTEHFKLEFAKEK